MNIAEKLNIKNKCECYSTAENKIRKAIMEFTIDEHRAFNLYQDTAKLDVNLDHDTLVHGLESLRANNGFAADDEGNVNFIYPVSALETKHIVTLSDGRKFCAMCAIDALGAAFTFKQDTVINSVCSNSDKPVRVEIKDGMLYSYEPETLYALHVDLNKFTDWASSC